MSNDIIRINSVIDDSIVDGPGLRLAVFTQGCEHNCPGCHNPATHALTGGHDESISSICEMIDKNPLLDGITLTGGEPFMQSEACAIIAKYAHKKLLTVWVYTGYTLDALRASNDPHVKELLKHTDVLVDGPFILEKRSLELKFRGSSNQRLINMAITGDGEPVEWTDPWDSLNCMF